MGDIGEAKMVRNDGTPRLSRSRLAGAVVLFALIGPLIGGVALVAFVYAMERRFEPVTREMIQIIVWFSYLFGGVQALLAGIGTAWLARRRGGTSAWHPVLVVAAMHVLFAGIVVGAGLASGRPAGPPLPFLAVASPILSLIAALACWIMARPLLRPVGR